MIDVWNGLRALAGDALIAAGTAVRDELHGDSFSERRAEDWLASGGRMECDGPDQAYSAALHDSADSMLLSMAADAIAADASKHAVLIAALRDRAAQFAALEADCSSRRGQ